MTSVTVLPKLKYCLFKCSSLIYSIVGVGTTQIIVEQAEKSSRCQTTKEVIFEDKFTYQGSVDAVH